MAKVTLPIGGRTYDVQCGDGDEAHLFRLANLVDRKTARARQMTPGLTEVRQLLFAAILLADEVHDLQLEREKHQVQTSLDLPPVDDSAADPALAARLNAIAKRVETLAAKLAASDASS